MPPLWKLKDESPPLTIFRSQVGGGQATLGGLDESDPRSVARLMKKMGQELGEDVSDVEAILDEPGGDDSSIDHADDI